jgi:hydroxymethylbilane synthase
MTDVFRLATRSSPLALWQARWVAARLRAAHPGLRVRLVPLTSSGDADRTTALYASSSVGVFVREIQAAVLAGEADAGVHSCKDLPTTSPTGLVLAAIQPRADVRDALITRDGRPLADLPHGALIGTSSLRRQTQLAHIRPDLRFAPIRGNVDTRLRKLASGEADATILAMAGLHRLGLVTASRAVPLDPWHESVPAPAQGAVALDCRSDDRRTRWLLAAINHPLTHRAITIERTILADLEGGCSLPLGCLVRRDRDGTWHCRIRLGDLNAPLRELTLSGDPTTFALRARAIRAC